MRQALATLIGNICDATGSPIEDERLWKQRK